MESSTSPLGIIAAIPEEITQLIQQLHQDPAMRHVSIGQRDYYIGSLWQQPCVVTLARVGKVAAATTVTALIHRFGVRAVLFTGVAGALASNIHRGDIVVATHLMQHDMDASPLFPRHEVPLLKRAHFFPCPMLTAALTAACHGFIQQTTLGTPDNTKYPIKYSPRIHSGLIISGDQFISDVETRNSLRATIPEACAVEMEGGAIAQVCYEYNLPFAVMRVISDSADKGALDSFPTFVKETASLYSYGIVQGFLTAYPNIGLQWRERKNDPESAESGMAPSN